MLTIRFPGWFTLALLMCFPFAAVPAQTKYQSADEAWRVGVAFYNSRNYAASREPFEAALKMAPDDAFRLKVYEALLESYRLLPDEDKYVEASHQIIENSNQAAKQSIVRRSLLSFMYQRGKIDELADRYEKILKNDANNRTALFILSELYSRVQENPQRAIELTQRLSKLNNIEGQPLDVNASANMARQYVQAKQYEKAAKLYEKIAPLDEKLAAWHWKEAATAWLQAGNKTQALDAARKSNESQPEQRSDVLAHFWHKGLADVFLSAGEPKLAIPHYEKAIEKTNIQGYIDASRNKLEEARAKAAE